MTRLKNEFDYVIVGAGSAGCVLANRLSQNTSLEICLIEAGSKDNSIGIRMPAALTLALESDKYNWKFESEPETALQGRKIAQARGRGLGGSSSINGMVFARGSSRDYDCWQEFGINGWTYRDCLPYFRRMESFESGRDPARGGSGPLSVSRSKAAHPLYQAFLQAGIEFGLPDAGDYNSGDPEGVHVTQATIRDGVRCSTSLAYLRPAMGRANLTVVTDALVERVDFDQNVAVGVTLRQRGQRSAIRAAREVILCAGTIGSPHLLLLSGIGDREHLRAHGIEPHTHAPAVGAGLQDHVVAPLRFRAKPGVSLAKELRTWGRLKLGAEWLLRKSGLGATNFFEVGAFFKSGPEVDYFNMQHEFLPFLADFQSGNVVIDDGFQYFVSQMRPHSRGSISLKTANPLDKPAIHFNYLTDQRDLTEMVAGIRKTREMAQQNAWNTYRSGVIDSLSETASDTEIAHWLRGVANTEHHPTSTCRMGTDDLAVTDEVGFVRDVKRLRIVDGSILPRIPSGNVNAPIIMVAEKLADNIVSMGANGIPKTCDSG